MNSNLKLAIDASLNAGKIIMKYYRDDYEIKEKGYHNPVTTADNEADSFLKSELTNARPDYGWLSEETVDSEDRLGKERVWIVDPLDGTKEFIRRNGEFTVNIALVETGCPVLGVVYRPVTDMLYLGAEGAGAWRIPGGGEPEALLGGPHYSEKSEVRVVASRSHLTPEVETFVEELRGQGREVEFLSAGSSLKLCLVAEGAADVYPRFGPTMEWDTGAAHAVAAAAGRQVLDAETRQPLSYNKENLLNPFFIVE